MQRICKQIVNLAKPQFAFSTTSAGTPKWRQYSVKAESTGYSAKSTTESNFPIITDMSKKVGGSGEGPSPLEVFLSSLVGCENITAQAIAKNLGFSISAASYDVKGERDERGLSTLPLTADLAVTSAFQRIWGTVYVQTDGTEEQLKQLNEILKKRCPVARMIVDSGCKLEVEWKKKI